MSQAKVDRYKEEKKNRKEAQAKAKRNALLTKICGGVIAAALVVWLGYSAVVTYQDSVNGGTVTVDTTALDEYMSELPTE